jgi:hypothetical protein
LVQLAAAIKEKTQRVMRPAAAVARFEPALVRFAEQCGLSTSRSPLAVFGAVPEAGLSVAAIRVKKGLFSMHARLELDQPHLQGFSILPHQKAVDGPGQVVTKHEVFDSYFQVCSTRPSLAKAFLDDSNAPGFAKSTSVIRTVPS